MAADPYKATATILKSNGVPYRIASLSGDDVDGAFLTDDDTGLTSIQLPQGDNYVLDDLVIGDIPVDTTKLRIVVNGVQSPYNLNDALLQNKSVEKATRVPRGIFIRGGAQLQFLQVA